MYSYRVDERRLPKSKMSRIKPFYLIFFFPLKCSVGLPDFSFCMNMRNSLNKWLAIIKNHLIGVERNPQTGHEERSSKSTCYYFLIEEQREGALFSDFCVSVLWEEAVISQVKGRCLGRRYKNPNHSVNFPLGSFVAYET